MAELDQQRCIIVPIIPVEDASAGDGEQITHSVSVTFLSMGGVSGLRPR
jgi:hypothetical protein